MPPAIGYWPMCNGRYLFCVDWKGEHFSFSLSQDCKIALRGIKETCNALSLNGNNNNLPLTILTSLHIIMVSDSEESKSIYSSYSESKIPFLPEEKFIWRHMSLPCSAVIFTNCTFYTQFLWEKN